MSASLYHLAHGACGVGSIIVPGNYGRIVRSGGWRHGHVLREMALEQARLLQFDKRPSRLDSAFVFMTEAEARKFQAEEGFQISVLFRVSLCDMTAPSHVTDWRLCNPQGTQRPDWASIYWMDLDAVGTAIPGLDWNAATNGLQCREMLTLSDLRIEQRLD